MESSRQIRHQNFMVLFKQFQDEVRREFPDEPDRGMLKRFAEKTDISEKYASHIKHDRKGIGSNLARKIEQALGLEPGWMDWEHGPLEPRSEAERAFLEAAMALFRENPVEAQAMLLQRLHGRAFRDDAA